MVDTLLEVIEGDETLPQRVTNRMVFVELRRVGRLVEQVQLQQAQLAQRLDAVEKRDRDCRKCRVEIEQMITARLEKSEQQAPEKYLSYKWVRETFSQPLVMMILSAIVATVIAKLF